MFNVGGAVISAGVAPGTDGKEEGGGGDSIEVEMYGPGRVLVYISRKPAGLLLEQQASRHSQDASRLRLKQPLDFDYDSQHGLLRAELPHGAAASADGATRFELTILL